MQITTTLSLHSHLAVGICFSSVKKSGGNVCSHINLKANAPLGMKILAVVDVKHLSHSKTYGESVHKHSCYSTCAGSQRPYYPMHMHKG